MKPELIDYLSGFVTEQRKNLFEETIKWRTRYLTVALENIYQAQNASAVLRTCDCFGIQDVHIIENENSYNINPDVALGSNKWLSMQYHNKNNSNTIEAINHLKQAGYRIVATTPHANDVNLDSFNLEAGKAALLFGTELNGLSNVALEMADEYVKIPMFGFTESFNISVSAAIILHTLTNKLRASKKINWQLSEFEKESILLGWYKSSIKNAEGIINKYVNK
ncbi:MAG TPA: TrmH family RNA methyltransferase [Bacteroidales bacterium]|jgi:tRNA (guanosine-2'-O-)-methyltransferase|nr:TrmH family RNA methyltransferase [Bacteroidales bacterium]